MCRVLPTLCGVLPLGLLVPVVWIECSLGGVVVSRPAAHRKNPAAQQGLGEMIMKHARSNCSRVLVAAILPERDVGNTSTWQLLDVAVLIKPPQLLLQLGVNESLAAESVAHRHPLGLVCSCCHRFDEMR